MAVNFSLGGVKRGFLVATTVLLLSVSLSACSDDSSPLDDKTTATPDAKAAAEAAVKDLVDGYWAAVVKAENSANPDPEQFRGVAKGTFIESELKRLRTYKDGNIRRVGEPEITAVEVTVTGDKADVRACLNEDDWAAEQDGKKLEAPGAGSLPWGAEASRVDGAWVVTDVRVPTKGTKKWGSSDASVGLERV